jgi:hypothetical protein
MPASHFGNARGSPAAIRSMKPTRRTMGMLRSTQTTCCSNLPLLFF